MRRLVTICVFLCCLPLSLMAQADLQVLAIVKLNGRASIYVKQVRSRTDFYEKQMQKSLSVDDRKKILDTIIDEKLVMQAAEKAGVTVPESAVDQYFLQSMSQQVGRELTEQELNNIIKQQFNMSLDDYLKQQFGMSLAEYKDRLRTTLVAQQYVLSQRQKEIQSIAPTDDEIRNFFSMNDGKFVQNEMLKMFIVNVPKASNAEAARAKVNELLNGYKSKKITHDQILVKSKTPSEGYNAVDAYINKNEISAAQLGVSIKSLSDIFARNKGYVSDVFDNPANFQFYVIMEKYSKKFLEIGDVLQPGSNVTVYEYIKSGLTQQKQAAYLQNALDEIAKSLDTEANVDRKKKDKDLNKLLSWEGQYGGKKEK